MVSTLKLTKIQIPNSDSDVISLDASTGNITLNKNLGGTSITVQGEGTATTNLQQGVAKCWVKFDPTSLSGTGTTGVGDSFNLTSMTDNGSGNHTITFDNNMNSAHYSTPTAPNADYTSGGVGVYAGANNHATGSFDFKSRRHDAAADTNYGGVTVHGDLA